MHVPRAGLNKNQFQCNLACSRHATILHAKSRFIAVTRRSRCRLLHAACRLPLAAGGAASVAVAAATIVVVARG